MKPPDREESASALGRRQFLQGLAATGAIAGTGSLLAACSSSGSSSPAPAAPASRAKRRGGSLKVGLTGGSGSDTLDPHKGLTYLDTARAQSLYQPLLQLNTSAQTEFVLAEEISPHGSTSNWVITAPAGHHLPRRQAAHRRRRHLHAQADHQREADRRNSLGPIDVNALKKLDTHTVQVPMTSPYGSFLDQLAYWYYLYIVPTGFNPANRTGPARSSTSPSPPASAACSSRTRTTGSPGLPYVDTLTIIDFSDSASLQNALVAGVIHGAGALEGPQMAALASSRNVRTVKSHTGAITPFTMRVDQAPFNDVNVRQAMRLLVDRPQLINSALDGAAVVGYDISSPYDPNYDTSLHRVQDIAQAKSLLKKAGQENLTVQLVTSPVATGTVAMATVLQQQAKAAGVTINLKQVDPTTFFGPNYLHWTFSQDFYNYSPYLAQVAQSLLPTSPFNETHWSLPHYVSLYKQANATANPALRREIEHEMQMIDFNEGGYIIPAFIDALDAYSTKITGYSAARVGQPLSDFDFEHYSFA